MSEVLNVQVREGRGKRNMKRLRQAGQVPGILYGHGLEAVSLAISSTELAAAVRHGSRLVDLAGGVKEKAFVRELQWDVYGVNVVHVDLTRVSEDERVRVHVQVELRGECPGVRDGGVIEHIVHEVHIECPVISIPEKLQLSINALNKGQAINVSGIPLPPGVKMLTPGDLLCVQCVEPSEEAEAAPAAEGAEPELIGRKPAEDEEGEE